MGSTNKLLLMGAFWHTFERGYQIQFRVAFFYFFFPDLIVHIANNFNQGSILLVLNLSVWPKMSITQEINSFFDTCRFLCGRNVFFSLCTDFTVLRCKQHEALFPMIFRGFLFKHMVSHKFCSQLVTLLTS